MTIADRSPAGTATRKRWPNKQRSGTLHAVDRIVALVDGRVAETGTAEELLAAGGYFAKLTRENT